MANRVSDLFGNRRSILDGSMVDDMVDVKEMTVEDMDVWASNAYNLMKVSEQEAEAKAFYRCGEFIRELGIRIRALEITKEQILASLEYMQADRDACEDRLHSLRDELVHSYERKQLTKRRAE